MKNVIVRAISGTAYVAIIVGAILAGEPWFVALTALFIILGVYEISRLTIFEPAPDGGHKGMGPAKIIALLIDVLAALAIGVLPFVFGANSKFDWFIVYAIEILALLVLFVVRVVAALYDKGQNPLFDVAKSVLSVAYLGVPMLALNLLYDNGTLVLLTFILIWINDTGAFCFGSKLGKRKLFPRLSPKKSWEGFFGGLGCCLAFGAACWAWINCAEWSIAKWLGYAAAVCVFSTWGDLFESLIKRSCHAKDSGHLIPGHGGILDRIDSLLLVAPAAYLFSMF